MSLLVDLLLLAGGGALLYFGAEWLVRGSAGLARAFGVSPLIVGLTVVAYGTSAPEVAVSVRAVIGNSGDLALGNVFGSCVANLALILGITALIAPPTVDGRLIRREMPVLLLTVLAAPAMLWNGVLERWEAAILLVGAAIFTAATLLLSSKDTGDDDFDAAEGGRVKLAGLTLIGLAVLIGGGELFVRGAVGVAAAFGMSEALIGATVVAIGTSLPELAASAVAATRGYSSLAVGNVIGSNIFNILLVLGVAGSVNPIHADIGAYKMQLGWLVGVTIIGILFMRGSRRVSRVEGGILTVLYAGFIAMLVWDAIA